MFPNPTATFGYGLTAQPASAVALTTVTGHLASNATCTAGGSTTVMSTASLAVGTYLLQFGGTAQQDTVAAVGCDIEMVAGTATAAFAGNQTTSIGSVAGTESSYFSFGIECIVTVTVAGTISLTCFVGGASGSVIVLAAGPTNSGPQATGYTATRIA